MTNWRPIRELTNTAIDVCEAVEHLEVTEQNRSDTLEQGGETSATLWDYLQRAWIAPENLAYSVIRARHQLDQNRPYADESSRMLREVGRLSSELVGAHDTDAQVRMSTPLRDEPFQSIETMVQDPCEWYRTNMIPSVSKIMERNRGQTAD